MLIQRQEVESEEMQPHPVSDGQQQLVPVSGICILFGWPLFAQLGTGRILIYAFRAFDMQFYLCSCDGF